MLAAPRSTGALAGAGSLKRELGATFALGWPIVLVNVAISVMTVTDIIMLGWLSPRALAAGALGFNLYLPPFLFGIGVVAALSPIAASMVGAGEERACVAPGDPPGVPLRRCCSRSSLGSYSGARRTSCKLIGERARSRRGRWDLHAGVPVEPRAKLVVLRRSLRFFALERPRPILVAGLAAVAFNALANYALIFGKLGMPALGIFGSGLATTLSQTLMVSLICSAPRSSIRGCAGCGCSPCPGALRRREMAALWRLGLPIGAMIVAEVGVFASSTLPWASSAARRSKRTRSRCRSSRLPSWSRLASARRRPFGSAMPTARATAVAIARAGWSAFGLTLVFALLSATAMIAAPRLLIAPFMDVDAPENASAVAIAIALLEHRRPVPDLRREPGDARQHAARAARFDACPSSSRFSAIGRSARRSAWRWDS